ncbi:EamA family transporter [Bacteroidales bacterium OttesenSCG-928-I21]|nr:EamA family transporter [Bacteroidales bacterium OttesenSCG-928-I21]
MAKLILLVIGQSILLVAAQTLLKISVGIFGDFSWTWQFFKTALTTWQFFLSGICALSSVFTWMYVLKQYDFSLAYPMLSISYIIGLLAAYFILHEVVPITRWVGVVIIMIGVFFVVK